MIEATTAEAIYLYLEVIYFILIYALCRKFIYQPLLRRALKNERK